MTITPGPTPALDKYQIGTQTALITSVDPTAQLGLVDKLTFSHDMTAMNLKDKRASAASYVAALVGIKGGAKMSGIVTYEDIPYWLDGLLGTATPSGSYTRAYAGMLGTCPTRKIFTLVRGQAGPLAHCYGLAGALLTKATFKVSSFAPMTYDLEFGGVGVASDAFVALSDRTQTPVLGNQMSLFIDAVGGTIGATAVASTWFSWELSIDTGAELYGGLGSLYSTSYHETTDKWKVTSKLSLELDATSKAIYDAIIGTSLVQNQVRVKATTGATQILQFDIAGSILKAPDNMGDTNGVLAIDLEYTDIYNTALANYLKVSSTNTIAAMA